MLIRSEKITKLAKFQDNLMLKDKIKKIIIKNKAL